MAWTSIGNIKGATGAQGPQGNPGTTGSPGAAATVAVGTTNTLSPGAAATVTNTGTTAAAVFNFGIPSGLTGSTGSAGTAGARGSLWYTGSGVPGTIAGQLPNDLYLDTASGNVYQFS